MPAAPETPQNDPLAGYFASVVFGLLASSMLADFMVDTLVRFFPNIDVTAWRVNLAAGYFIGIAFANPVGAYLTGSGRRRSAIRMVIGFIGGVAIQKFILSPVAGTGMSHFMLLLVAGIAVPGILMVGWLRQFLDKRGILPADQLATGVLRILSWPDRLLFVLLMGTSFTLFWRLSATPSQVMMILAAVLIMLTFWVTMRQVPELLDIDPEEAERRAWLDLEPEPNASLVSVAKARINNMARTLLPGAILFGGVMRLAVEFLLIVYPSLNIDFADPIAAAKSIAIVAASGLAVVFFGMMAALGFGLFIIQMIGRKKGWSQGRLRENYVHMIRAMYFRPMDRT